MSLLSDDGFHSSAMIVELERALMHKHEITFSQAQKFVLEGRAQLGMSRWEPPTQELERICEEFCKGEADVTETTLDESSSEYIDDDGSVYLQEESSPGDQSKPWEVDASKREEYRYRKPLEQQLTELDRTVKKGTDVNSVDAYEMCSDDQDDEILFAPDEDFSALWVKEDASYIPAISYYRREQNVEDDYDEYGDDGDVEVETVPDRPCLIVEREQYAEDASQETDLYLSDAEEKGSSSVATNAIYTSDDEVHEDGPEITFLTTAQNVVLLPDPPETDANSVDAYEVYSDDQDDEILFNPDDDFSALWLKEDASYISAIARYRQEHGVEDDCCDDAVKGVTITAIPIMSTEQCDQYAEDAYKGSQQTDPYISDAEKKDLSLVATGALYTSDDEVHGEQLEQGTGIASLTTAQSAVLLPDDQGAASSNDRGNTLQTVVEKDGSFAPSNVATCVQDEAKESYLSTTCKTREFSESPTVSLAKSKEVPAKPVATSSHPTEIGKEDDSDGNVSSHSVASGIRARDKYSEPPKVIYLLRQYMTDYIDAKKVKEKGMQRKVKAVTKKVKNVKRNICPLPVESKNRTSSVTPDRDKKQSESTPYSHNKIQPRSPKSLCNQSRSSWLISGSYKSQSCSLESVASRISKTSSRVHVFGTRNVVRDYDSQRSVTNLEMKKRDLIKDTPQPSTKSPISKEARALKTQQTPKKKSPLFSLFRSSAPPKAIQFVSSTSHAKVDDVPVHPREQKLPAKRESSSADVFPPVFSYVASDDPSVGNDRDELPFKEITVTLDPDDSNQCVV